MFRSVGLVLARRKSGACKPRSTAIWRREPPPDPQPTPARNALNNRALRPGLINPDVGLSFVGENRVRATPCRMAAPTFDA
jgi:hypothetical protein